MLVDYFIITLMFGLFLNYGIMLLSIRRVIRFITRSSYKRGLSYALLVPFSVVYLNRIFQMLAFGWGATAFDLSWYFYRVEGFDFFDFVHGYKYVMTTLHWSKTVSIYTPLVFSLLFFSLLFGLSFDYRTVKDGLIRNKLWYISRFQSVNGSYDQMHVGDINETLVTSGSSSRAASRGSSRGSSIGSRNSFGLFIKAKSKRAHKLMEAKISDDLQMFNDIRMLNWAWAW